MAAGIGHADQCRRQTDQQHVGKHDAEQSQHEARLGIQRFKGQRHGYRQNRQRAHNRGGDHQSGNHRVGRAPHFLLTFLDLLLFEDRDERGGERPFAEQAAKQVRHLKSERERAGHPGVAHERGVNHLP